MSGTRPTSTPTVENRASTSTAEAPESILSLSEAEYVSMILDRAAARGWLCYHARPAMVKGGWRTPGQGNGARGFPDVIAARAGQLLIWEVKTERGRLTPEQTAWLEATGGECIRPSDWPKVCRILDAAPRTTGGF